MVFQLIVRIIIGLLLLISGLLKIPDLKGFHLIVLQYGLFKGRLAKYISYSIPFSEIIIGVLLLTGIFTRLFSAAALILLLISTLGVFYALIKRKRLINCGCYGTIIKSPLTITKLIENLIWISLTIYLLL